MTLRITTTWPALFTYAHAEGQARLAYNAHPNQENQLALDKAIKEHENYRKLCLEADEMIGLPNVSDIMSGKNTTHTRD